MHCNPSTWVALAGLALISAVPARAAHSVRVSAANSLSLSVTNYGVLGNNFTSRASSLEYPAASGYEHLVLGGLWIGAHAQDAQGSFTGVTTSVLDGAIGAATPPLTEFSPIGGFEVRSKLPFSSDYHPHAVSEEDMIAFYADSGVQRAANNSENHRPLGVHVRQISHEWSVPGYGDFIVLRYVVTNRGAFPLADVWVGMYAEFASGNKGASPTWPPTGWFRKAWLQYDAGQRLLREHYCSASPVPDSCHLERVPAWAGMALLTPPGAGHSVTVAGWDYSPFNPARNTDEERYAILSAGTVADVDAPPFVPTGDPVEILGLGPFASIAPGDSVEVDFAIVGGAEIADIQQHTRFAQSVRDAGFPSTVGAPIPSPPGRLSLAPERNPCRGNSITLRIGIEGSAPARLELVDVSGRLRDERLIGPRGASVVRLGNDLTPGVYFARLGTGHEQVTTRLVLLGR